MEQIYYGSAYFKPGTLWCNNSISSAGCWNIRSKSETSPLMKVKDEFTVKFILIVLCLRILMDQFAIGVQFDYHFRQFLTIQK